MCSLLTEFSKSVGVRAINISPLAGLKKRLSAMCCGKAATRSSRQRDNLLGRILHSISHRETQTRLANHPLAFFNIGAFQPNYNRDFHPKVVCRAYHSARHHVAANDASENIDQDCAHIRIGQKDAESCFDPLLRSAATHVEKVC